MAGALAAAVSDLYRTFAEREAHGRSELYEALARGVAADPAMLAFLVDLPPPKRQPNLLFAAVQLLAGAPRDWPHFQALVRERGDEVRSIMLARRTQTNEPARCATLLPVLSRLPQPLALLEIGAAAGLCLLPDRYGYEFDGASLPPTVTGRVPPPTFTCRTSGAGPRAGSLRVAWRAGLDLEPIAVGDDAQVAWLEALVWPDEGERLARLRAAVRVAREDPPPVVRGDLRVDVAALAAQAPASATLVIFHTAVLAYVGDAGERAEFAGSVRRLGAVWISNEAPSVFPELAARARGRRPPGWFLLSVDGEPVAWTDPHGAALEWIESRW